MDDLAETLMASLPGQPVKNVTVRGRVRVDKPHPRRREKAGDFIDMADLRVTLAARSIWAGWTPGVVVKVTLASGAVVTSPWVERLTCCDLHGRNCEPPSELCCEYCGEAYHPKHAIQPCVLDGGDRD
jgi:hypothetical protein